MIKCVEKHLCHNKKSLTQSKIDTVNKYKPNCEALRDVTHVTQNNKSFPYVKGILNRNLNICQNEDNHNMFKCELLI